MFEKIKKVLKNRKVQSTLIIVFGLITGFLILQNPQKPLKAENNKNRLDSSALSYINSIPDYIKGSKKQASERPVDNFTDFLSNEYLRKIIQENPDGPEEANGEKFINAPALSSFDLKNTAIDKKVEEYFQIKNFTEKDINVSSDSSVESQIRYIEEISKIGSEKSIKLKKSELEIIDGWINTKRNEELEVYVNILNNQLDSLLNVSVPSNWKSVHIQMLNLIKRKILAFDAMKNLERDPIKAVAGFRRSIELMEESTNLFNVVLDKFKDLESQNP